MLEAVDSLNAAEPGFRLGKLRLNARQRALLQALRVEGRLSARDVAVPQQTFHRDMQRLIEARLVTAIGEKRGRVYVLAEQPGVKNRVISGVIAGGVGSRPQTRLRGPA